MRSLHICTLCRTPRSTRATGSYDESEHSHPLPRARYLLKLAEEEKSDATVTAYVVRLLQQQGMECVAEEGHVVVSAEPGKLKSQVI